MIAKKVNKKNVRKAIDFLKSLAPKSFIANEQTKGFDPKNIGKFHCVYGHLVVNPKSPFYTGKDLTDDKTETGLFADTDTFPYKLHESTKMIQVNNNAPNATRKKSVIKHLEAFYSTLTA